MTINRFIFAPLAAFACLTIHAETLPAPQTTGGMPLMQAMAERKSIREYDLSKPVTKQELSNMLWAAWGITHDGKHTIATAMNKVMFMSENDMKVKDAVARVNTILSLQPLPETERK